MGLRTWFAALIGISAYQAGPSYLDSLDSPEIEKRRQMLGGQIVPLPQTRTRWYGQDVEIAAYSADAGDISIAAQLMAGARSDGTYAGVLSTRTAGLVRLPKTFRGDPEIVDALQVGGESVRSVFDEMCPPGELAAFAADIVELNIAVGELVPVVGREYPVFVRLLPEFLIYRWSENRWYYRSAVGLLPITPGDGRWVLHVGGRVAPWRAGIWRAIGRAYIRKEHAGLHKDTWESKLAHPARVAVSPQGAGEKQKDSWYRKVMAWGKNTVFGVTPGYDVRLLESNGRGYESFDGTQDRSDREMIVAVAGQVVTTDGGAGFQNSDIHKTIRADLIKETADALAYTLNTQVIPVFVVLRYGEDALERSPCVAWDVTPPKDRNSEATSLVTMGQAIDQLGDALKKHGAELDVGELCARFRIPIKGDKDGDGKADDLVDEPKGPGVASARPRLELVSDDEDDEDDSEAAA